VSSDYVPIRSTWRCRMLVCCVVLAWPAALSYAAAADLEDTYRSYVASVKRGDTVDAEVWTRQFETALRDDPAARALLRTRVLDELGALYGSIGRREQAIASYERLLQESAACGDADGKVVALQNMLAIRRTGEPSTEVVALFDEYQEVLRDPPPQYLERFTRHLVDSHYQEGQYYQQLAKRAESPEARTAFLERADENIQFFLANSQDRSARERDGALFHAAEVVADLGRNEEAAAIYMQLAESSETFARSWMFHEAIKQRYDTKSEAYQNALKGYLDEHEPDGYYRPANQALAGSYLSSGKGALAIPILEELIEEETDEGVLAYHTYLLGASYIDAGMTAEGMAILLALIQEWPDSPSAEIARKLANRTAAGREDLIELLDGEFQPAGMMLDEQVDAIAATDAPDEADAVEAQLALVGAGGSALAAVVPDSPESTVVPSDRSANRHVYQAAMAIKLVLVVSLIGVVVVRRRQARTANSG